MAELFLNELFGVPSTVFRRGPPADNGYHHNALSLRNEASSQLAVDFYEEGDTYVLQADLPGFEKENIDVHIDDRTLSLEATRIRTKTVTSTDADPAEGEGEGDGEGESEGVPKLEAPKVTYYRRERSTDKVARAFHLPVNAAKDQAEVTYVDGVLTVTIPKQVNPGAKKLTIA